MPAPSRPRAIAAYFSHSYRANDREVNRYFWQLLHKEGFALRVDPKTDTLSVPFLEVMMKQSACFAAVITHRPDRPPYRCSPFILFEYGLAVQANKPRLVFVERNVSGRYFPNESPGICPFNRDGLEDDEAKFVTQIQHLADISRPYRNIDVKLRGKVGLITDSNDEESYPQALRQRIKELVDGEGYTLEEVDLRFDRNFEWSIRLDHFDFVILDVGPSGPPAWVYASLHGRFVPAIRLLRLSSSGVVPALSPLVSGQILRVGSVDSDSLIFWRQDKDLLAQLKVQLEKFGTERTEIRDKQQGNRYFRSLGRRQDLVFLSNAADSNDFAKVLSAKLRLENITHFQYKAENNFTLGEDWEKQLSTKVESSRVFAMLITPGYPQSQWCQFEFKLAEGLQASGRLKIIPYFLEEVSEMKVKLHGRDLRGMSPEQQASIIAKDLDTTLTVKDPVEVSTVAGETERRAAEWQNGPVDLAIVTIRPEEFGPVLKRLDRTWRYRPTKDKPDLGAWQLGEVTSPAYERPYKVVVSMAARRGNISGEVVTRRTIERWEPRYVVLAGIAGGLPINELAKGDVVVSSIIYAYEYGKIHKKFAPRHDFIYQVDDPLVRNALALAFREPHWAEDVRVKRPEAGTRPKILDGPLASGDKLVDDITNTFFADVLKSFPKLQAIEMEGAGAASAIQAAREEARVVGFLMIRGISDMPRSGAATVPRATKQATGPSEGAIEQSKQRDLWKDYAADTAASVAIQLLRYGWPVPPA